MDGETIQVLLVDDDAGLRDLLRIFFQQRGIEFSVLHHATNLTNRLALERPSIVVLDVMMPGVDGLTALRQLREKGDTIPVIMLTSLAEDVDRVLGLEFGADDYLGKPFTPLELLARIRAVLRRHSSQAPLDANGRQGMYCFGRFRMEPAARALYCDDQRIKLTGTNYALLEVLVTHPMETLSRAKLLDLLYGPDAEITERGMDLSVWRLRRLLEKDPSQPCVIQTVRGVGYMFVPSYSDDEKPL
ncbi:response regulator [Paraburkholderia fungorum]|jgi:two-component system, OmpR family, phosphate regulon response regulator OmpR|uniref:response regulator n=1 Tax=Paraburkholderia fungorum TaxID=134537 RepID=UPI000413EA61|nr:response regulator [Paraburkholderia fungorum]PZR47911.1 MAG: DNA-binding response regulator [Paraburkholderia fungorum]